jgi:multiple sugar transport system substrate-binding protein
MKNIVYFTLSLVFAMCVASLLLVSPSPVLAQQEEALRFWTFEYADAVDPFFEDYVKEWNGTHKLQVKRQEFPWEQYTGEVLTTGIATGEAPDVFFISPGDWRRYAEGGLALPLNDYFPDYLKKDMLPASLEAVTLNGKIYSMPFEMEPVALWYNKEMLKEAGLEVPTSWEELVSAAAKLTKENRYGILIPTSPGYYENFVFYPFLWMAGGEVVNKDFTAAAINTPEAARAFDLWGDLIAKGYAASTSTGSDPTDERFPTGQAAMFVSGYWVYGWLQATHPEFLDKLGVAAIPPVKKGDKSATVYGGWTAMVYAKTKYPKEAAEFAINMFGAPENARATAWGTKYNTKLSPRPSVVKDNPDFYAKFPHDIFSKDIFAIARPEPAYPPEVAQAVWEAIQEVMFKKVSGKDAVATMAKKIDAYLKTR